jgi:hypothetical protein
MNGIYTNALSQKRMVFLKKYLGLCNFVIELKFSALNKKRYCGFYNKCLYSIERIKGPRGFNGIVHSLIEIKRLFKIEITKVEKELDLIY